MKVIPAAGMTALLMLTICTGISGLKTEKEENMDICYMQESEFIAKKDLTSGWQSTNDTKITARYKRIYDKAAGDIEGLSISPVAVIAENDRGGEKIYMYLCVDKRNDLKMAYIRNSKDNAEIMGIENYVD